MIGLLNPSVPRSKGGKTAKGAKTSKAATSVTSATAAKTGKKSRQRKDTGRQRLDAIHGEIRDRICTLTYPPGETLRETELAEEFGVSRTPIRQVLQRLEFEGLVESKHGVGTIVSVVDLPSLKDVYALRMKLAELIGELNPLPRSEDDIAALRGLQEQCNRLRAEHREPQKFARINMAVHEVLYSAIGNQTLRDMLLLLFYKTARVWMHWVSEVNWDEEIEIFSQEIGELLRAMEAGDMRAVGFSHRNHISMSLIRISRYFAVET